MKDEQRVFRGKPISDWIAEITHFDTTVSGMAIINLHDAGPDAEWAVPALSDAIRGPVGTIAASALIEIGPAGTKALHQALNSKSRRVRLRATRAFQRGIDEHDPSALVIIHSLAHLLNDKSADLRGQAAIALSTFGPRAVAATTALVSTLHDANADVSRWAATALKKIGPIAIPVLLEDFPRGSEITRLLILDVLFSFGSAARPAVSILIRALKAPQPAIRQMAARALGAIGPVANDAGPALRKLISHPGLDRLTIWIYFALAKIGHCPQGLIIPMFVECLEEGPLELQLEVSQALGYFGTEAVTAVQGLIRLLNQSTPQLRRAAARALGRIGPAAKKAVLALTVALNDEDYYVRDEAVTALGEIGWAARVALPALRALCKQTNGPAAPFGVEEAIRMIESSRPSHSTDNYQTETSHEPEDLDPDIPF
jgi:HEAT repeat protein